MAKKPAQVVTQSKADPKRDRTVKNRQTRLERHLKRFPEDKVAKTALGKEKPARKASKNKGAFPKAVVRICEPVCVTREVGSHFCHVQKKNVPTLKNGSGFVTSKHREGKVLFFGSVEPIMVETVGKNGRPGLTLNPNAVEAWEAYLAESRKRSQRKPRGQKR